MAHGAGDLDAVLAWDHDVEQDEVVQVRAGVGKRGVAVRDRLGVVAALFKDMGENFGEPGLVFDDEDVHRAPSSDLLNCTREL